MREFKITISAEEDEHGLNSFTTFTVSAKSASGAVSAVLHRLLPWKEHETGPAAPRDLVITTGERTVARKAPTTEEMTDDQVLEASAANPKDFTLYMRALGVRKKRGLVKDVSGVSARRAVAPEPEPVADPGAIQPLPPEAYEDVPRQGEIPAALRHRANSGARTEPAPQSSRPRARTRRNRPSTSTAPR